MRAAAAELLRKRLAQHGISLEPEPDRSFLMHVPAADVLRLKLLAAAAPHRRGGRGSWGLHWLLHSDAEDYVAMVDVSREAAWVMPAAEFRARAQPLFGSKFHLDWLVWRLSPRSEVEDESAFDEYLLETDMRRWTRRTLPGRPKRQDA